MPNKTRLGLPLLAIVAFIAWPSVSRAQHIGLTVARTKSDIFTTYSNDGTGDAHPDRESFGAGVTYRHHLRSRMVLQPELLWVPKGYSRKSSPTRTLGYVEVPVLLRIGAVASTGQAFSPVLTVGPTVSVLASCRLDGLNSITKDQRCDQAITTPYSADFHMRRFDVGSMLGLGFEGRSRNGTILGADVRYERGFVDIERQNGTSTNRMFFVTLHVVPSQWY